MGVSVDLVPHGSSPGWSAWNENPAASNTATVASTAGNVSAILPAPGKNRNKLIPAGQVGEVMDDSRQAGATAAAVTQGEPLHLPADPGHPSMGSGLLRLVAHTGRRLHRHDSDIEPAGDGGGEQAGPGTEIKH